MAASIFNPFNLFTWKGRINRPQFWMITICSSITFLLPLFKLEEAQQSNTLFVTALSLNLTIIMLAAIKRCHDLNRSGVWMAVGGVPLWWVLAMFFSLFSSVPHYKISMVYAALFYPIGMVTSNTF